MLSLAKHLTSILLNSRHDSQCKCISQGCERRQSLDIVCSCTKIQNKVCTHHKTYFDVLIHRSTSKPWNLSDCPVVNFTYRIKR